jgi:hypothetical protein
MCVNLKAMCYWTPNWKQICETKKRDLDKLEINKDIRHKHGNEIYVIERFVINVLWKEIISCLWVYGGARINVL